MARPLFDSEYIFGSHEPGGEEYMLQVGRPGWVLFNEAIGRDPNDRSSLDFSTFSSQELGVICRLNHGFEPEGTLPHSRYYEPFARRVANFVGASRGCKIWVIGNEMNYAVERPGIQIDWSRHSTSRTGPPETADPLRRGLAVRFNVLPDHSTEIRTTRAAMISPGEQITPELYARCYKLCRDAIHRLPGHEDDQVLVGAVAPWNTQTMYTGNANGDWVQYFRDILEALGPKGCDGFTLHTYTHGPEVSLISAETRLEPPFQTYHREFRAYQDFMAAVPPAMRHLPAYITEADQVLSWLDRNTGWVQQAYKEIDSWNRAPGTPGGNQQIRALILYRWPRLDRWFIDGKYGVIDDFRAALEHDYRWQGIAPLAPPSEIVEPTTPARVRTPTPVPAEPSAQPTERPAPSSERRKQAQAAVAKAPETLPYQIEWLTDRFPTTLLAGETITATLTLRNTGAMPWTWGGGNPFRLGYHYYRGRRRLTIAPGRDLRTDIPHDVQPGGVVNIEARIALPEEPGNYTLELDLVQEGVTWFKARNSPVLTRWLTVEAPSRPSANGAEATNSNLPVPLFLDISSRLPRAGTYARRSLSQIRHIVISHTAGHPWLSLERIARSHIQYGYPGIVYDFVVDPSGQVYRVSALEDVAQPDQAWSEQGVNIGLAGNFSSQPPPMAQIDATGRLCAWLAQNLGLAPDTIIGLGELTKSDSPGATFYSGPAWKQLVVRQVQLHLAALNSGGDNEESSALTAALDKLKAENTLLAAQLKAAQDEGEKQATLAEQLQGEVAELQRQLVVQPDSSGPRLRIQNIIEQLPRDPHRYVERRAEEVQYIVINHTGVAPAVSWQEIANAHRPDWPGILYDFCINEHGGIFQAQPLDEVAETDQVYLSNAINLAFAGEFNRSIPSEEQIRAGGQLIAWLLERFPNVKLENIRGIREFIEHTSPGEQWQSGKKWKESLLVAVRRARGLVDPSEIENQLRKRAGELELQLEQLQQLSLTLQQQKSKVEEENQRLKGELAEKLQLAKNYVIPPPSLRNIVDQLPKHPTLRYERRSLSQITHLAVHHTAAPPTLGPLRIAELHIAPDATRGKEAWPGIGYHFFVHADGAIDQTNHLESASYHVYRHNGYSAGVVFAGSFMNGKIPTSAQLRAGAHLIAWLMQELHIPLARVWGHREFPENSTVCPGNEWTLGNRWRDLLFERIEQVQNGIGVKSIRHYLLFWQRPHPGPLARQDFVNAIGYIARFRPTAGFALEDAKYAEYVTIIGNEAGVSAADEKLLLSHGCKVERVAGRDEEETGRILAEMARQGRRFTSFDVDF